MKKLRVLRISEQYGFPWIVDQFYPKINGWSIRGLFKTRKEFKMNEIRYETKMEDVNFKIPTVFLAGPTVRGNQPHLTSWRFEAIDLFKQKNFDGNLIIPEFVSKTESDKGKLDIPIWEYNGLSQCGAIMFWIPRTKELIGLTTNCEFGYWMARDRGKMIYGRPNDSYRNTYLDIMWVEDAKRHTSYVSSFTYTTLNSTIDASLKRLNL